MSAQSLDKKRLLKQLLEGRQIYFIITTNKTKGGWVNHPAIRMWRNYDTGLFSYLEAIKDECVNRGIKTDKNWNAIVEMHNSNWDRGDSVVMPPWWGDERIHQSHRNNLYRKDPEYYAEFANDEFISCCDRCSYFWPVANHAKDYSPVLI